MNKYILLSKHYTIYFANMLMGDNIFINYYFELYIIKHFLIFLKSLSN